MLAIFKKGWVHGYNRDGRAVAGYYRKASPGTEQRAFDFYASKPVRPGTTREQRDAGQAGADNGLMMVVRGDVRQYRDYVASGVVVDVVNAETGRTLRQIDKAIKPRAFWTHEGGRET